MASKERGAWSGHLGFVLAAAGSAIGLGNVWMFPFRTGQNGGAAFVLAYLAAVLLVGIPLLIAEISIGRSTRRNPVGAFRVLRPGSPWNAVGWLGVIAGFVILSYYGVVAGWAVDYVWMSGSGQLTAAGADIEGIFGALTTSPVRQVFWQSLFMLATILVVSGGVEAGIERASRVLMPLLLGLLLVLLGYALTSDGAAQGLNFLLQPRFEELGSEGLLQALGQAFFSLSLGMGAMITYGSYLEPTQSVVRSAFVIAVIDTLLAILAGLVIFPLVFTFGLEPSAGPGLVFITLPKAFAQMPLSALLSTLFFALLLFAALTSAISLLEVVVAFLVDEWEWARKKAAWIAGGIIFALGVPSAVFPGFLDRADGLATNWLLPGGGLLIAIFTGWILQRDEARAAFFGETGEAGEASAFGPWLQCVKWLAPVAVSMIFLQRLGLF